MPSAGKMVFADVIKDLNQGGPPTPTAGVLRGGSGDPETQTQRRQRRSHVAANPGAPGTRTARRGRRDPPQSPWWERARQPLENCEHVTFCGLKLLSSWCFPAAASEHSRGGHLVQRGEQPHPVLGSSKVQSDLGVHQPQRVVGPETQPCRAGGSQAQSPRGVEAGAPSALRLPGVGARTAPPTATARPESAASSSTSIRLSVPWGRVPGVRTSVPQLTASPNLLRVCPFLSVCLQLADGGCPFPWWW